MTKVFVSSVGGALAPYRTAVVDVCHRLGLLPIHMEEFPPASPPPLDYCLSRVDQADVFVLLLAHRAGATAPGTGRTFTQHEYDHATARGLPVHAFVVDRDFPWLPSEITADDAKAMAAFVSEVRATHVTRGFGELATFREDVLLLLAAYRDPEAPAADAPAEPTIVSGGFSAIGAYVAAHPFTGRAADLAVLDAWASSESSTLVVESIGGVGKTALTWHWTEKRAAGLLPGLAGRFWWSFYEGSASMTRFLHELAAYVSGRSREECGRLDHADLLGLVTSALDARPYLIVLDGLERLLGAYHRYDPTRLLDEEVDAGARDMIEQRADDALRILVRSARSKILISTRLMPRALQTTTRQPIVGVRHLALGGLTRDDCLELVERLGVTGDRERIAGFFDRLGNHALLVAVVAGLVRDYRRDPGNFDRWLDDASAGGALRLQGVELWQRRDNVLRHAMRGLSPDHGRMLGWIAELPGPVDYATLESVNPFVSPPPQRRAATLKEITAVREAATTELSLADAVAEARLRADKEHDEAVAAMRRSPEHAHAMARLDAALSDLEDRGLLVWDRRSNTYDLHPIVRAVAHDGLEESERVLANETVRNHFSAMPAESVETAGSVEDLKQTITIFQALVGCGRIREAENLYSRGLGRTLRFRLGAYATITELLEPVGTRPEFTAYAAVEMVNGLMQTGRLDAAFDLCSATTLGEIASGRPANVRNCLTGLAIITKARGELIASQRCLAVAQHEVFDDGDPNVGGTWVIAADLARATGDYATAAELLERATLRGRPTNLPSFDEDVALQYARIAADQGTLTAALLAEVDRCALRPSSPRGAALARHYWLDRGETGQALLCAEQVLRDAQASGVPLEEPLAGLARVLVHRDEAQAGVIVDRLLEGLDRTPYPRRPFGLLADTLRELGRDEEASRMAIEAYRWAWCEGPPNAFAAPLKVATDRLRSMGVEAPTLPTVDPATVEVPLIAELNAFVAARTAPPST